MNLLTKILNFFGMRAKEETMTTTQEFVTTTTEEPTYVVTPDATETTTPPYTETTTPPYQGTQTTTEDVTFPPTMPPTLPPTCPPFENIIISNSYEGVVVKYKDEWGEEVTTPLAIGESEIKTSNADEIVIVKEGFAVKRMSSMRFMVISVPHEVPTIYITKDGYVKIPQSFGTATAAKIVRE